MHLSPSAGPATWKQHKEEIDRREEERLAKRVERWRAARDKFKARELHKHEIWHSTLLTELTEADRGPLSVRAKVSQLSYRNPELPCSRFLN